MDEKKIDSLISELLGNSYNQAPSSQISAPNITQGNSSELEHENHSEQTSSFSPTSHTDEQKEESEWKHPWLILVIILIFGIAVFFVVHGFPSRHDYYEEYVDSIPAIEESCVKEDSLRWAQNSTFELGFFEVHGPVKRLYQNNHTYEFDREGNLMTLDGYNPFTVDVYSGSPGEYTHYEKDSKGHIFEETAWESMASYTWESNRVTRCDWHSESWGGIIEYNYKITGQIESQKFTDMEIDEITDVYTLNYTYKLDKFGNWIQRKDDAGNTTSRRIEYYDFKKPVFAL